MRNPSEKQLAVRDWMRDYQRQHGLPPTIREMCEAFQWASTNTAKDYLRSMERKGLVRQHGKHVSRGWLVCEEQAA